MSPPKHTLIRQTDTTLSVFRPSTLMTTAGRTFLSLATARQVSSTTTTVTEHSPMWLWWLERPSTKTVGRKRGWAQPSPTLTETAGSISLKPISPTTHPLFRSEERRVGKERKHEGA